MNNDINSFLFSTGSAFSFENVGDIVEGEILNAEMRQQTDVQTGEPLTFADGKPRMQLVITLQTKLRDKGDDDDGVRQIYAKGGNFEVASGSGTSMRNAIADAVKEAGAKSLDEGGKLAVSFTGLGKAKSRGFSQPKLYTAAYQAPKASVSAESLFSDE